MKRRRDGGFDDDLAERERVDQGPLVVVPLAATWRGRRWLIPVVLAALALTFLLAVAGRYADYFAGPSHTPPPPSAVAWIAATAIPTPTPLPSVTPDPNATPDPAATPEPSPSPAPTQPPMVEVKLSALTFSYSPGQTVEFRVTLSNRSALPLYLEACPTYRMYLSGSPGTSSGPTRVLNCEPIGSMLDGGQSIIFEMRYEIPADAASGQQLLIWELLSGLNGNASTDIAIWPAGPTPNLRNL